MEKDYTGKDYIGKDYIGGDYMERRLYYTKKELYNKKSI